MALDDIDHRILTLLTDEGRISYADLAQRVGLTGPSVADRIRRLESTGILRGFTARLDGPALGLTLTAFIAVTLEPGSDAADFTEALHTMPEVLECHHTAGADDYLLKVCVPGTSGLEDLISERLKKLPGVARTHSTVVLSTAIDRPVTPL